MSFRSCAHCCRNFDDSEANINRYTNNGNNDSVCSDCNKEYQRVNKTAVFLEKVRAKKGLAIGLAAIPLALRPNPRGGGS